MTSLTTVMTTAEKTNNRRDLTRSPTFWRTLLINDLGALELHACSSKVTKLFLLRCVVASKKKRSMVAFDAVLVSARACSVVNWFLGQISVGGNILKV